MKTKELIASFEQAPWESQGEVEAFVRAAGAPSSQDLEKLLALLAEDGATDPVRSERRRRVFSLLVERAPSRELFRPFVRALSHGDPDVRSLAAALLPRLNDVGSHEELLALLRSDDEDTRQAAAAVIPRVGTGATLQRLLPMLQEPELVGRLETLDAAVALGGPKALPGIVATLRLGSIKERVRALDYLGTPDLVAQNAAGARETLRSVFSDPSDEIVVAAVRAFGRIAGEDDYFRFVAPGLTSTRLDVVDAIVRGLARFPSPRALDQLERKIAEGPARIRIAAIETLEEIGGDLVVPLLSEAISHSQIAVQSRAAEALARLGASDQVDLRRTVQWLLRSPSASVRRLAVHVAVHLSDPDDQLWPQLLSHLRDADWWVRERVVDGLVHLGGEKVYTSALQMLADGSPLARMYAIAVLERLGLGDAREVVRAVASNDDDPLVKERAVEAIASSRDLGAVPLLTALLEDEGLELPCLEALQALGAKDAASAVARSLLSADLDVRMAALNCLDRIDDPEQLGAVRPLLSDPDPRVQSGARALAQRWMRYQKAPAAPAELGTLDELLERAAVMQADSVVLAAGARPIAKQGGASGVLADVVLSADQMQHLVLPLLSPKQRERLHALEDIDASLPPTASGVRFHVSVFSQHRGLTAVFHRARAQIVELEQLGLPHVVSSFTEWKNGLVLLCGPAKSGKSTTLHALIRRINQHSTRHVVALQKTVDAIHQPTRSVVTQREIGAHAPELSGALRAALREDADVIVLDDAGDAEAMRFVVTAAETGHLILATLQAPSIHAGLERLVSAFPDGQREHVRAMLATSLRAAVCQHLLARSDGQGHVAAAEVLLNTSAAANLIRKGKAVQLPSLIATSAGAGMRSWSAEVSRLLRTGVVDPAAVS